MKVLFLGNSNDVQREVAGDQRATLATRALEEAFGEPVEWVVKTIWPTPVLPKAVEKWMNEVRPDMVYLNVIAFWFTYESVPLKIERMLGPIGKPVKDAGIKASQVPWLGHNAVFHWLRQMAQRTIGGATFFEPEQVIASMSECIRVIVRREDTALVVKGARSSGKYLVTERARQRSERRRREVQEALSSLCAELHLEYIGSEGPRYLTRPEPDYLGDNLHTGLEAQARDGEEIAGILKAAWERHRALVG